MNSEKPKEIELQDNEIPEMISITVICRLCANQSDKLLSIFNEDSSLNDLGSKINLYLPVKISETDNLPVQCCWQCASTVLTWHNLFVTAVETDHRLRNCQLVSEKDLLENIYQDAVITVEQNAESQNSNSSDKDVNEDKTVVIPGEVTVQPESQLRPLSNVSSMNLIKLEYLDDDQGTNDADTEIITLQVTTTITDNNLKNHECSYCCESFQKRDDLLKHVRDIHCEKSSEKINKLSNCEKTTNEENVDKNSCSRTEYSCPYCNKKFTRKFDVNRHIKGVHNKKATTNTLDISCTKYQDNVDVQNNACKLCEISFSSKLLLKKHMRDKHNIKEAKIRRRQDEIGYSFFCEVCSKGFTRKYDMHFHMSKQHPRVIEIPTSQRAQNSHILEVCRVVDSLGTYYKCDFCEQTFKRTYNLIRHRSIHTGEKRHFCDVCGKTFRLPQSLKQHINNMHLGQRNYTCTVCLKKFTTHSNMKNHMNIHLDKRPYTCEICGKSFRQSSTLSIHKLFHSNRKKYLCPVCGKTFRRSQDLKLHVYIHTGEKPYKCRICDVSFRLPCNLKKHKRIHDAEVNSEN